ncbi:conserved domain protein [[Ruminococcus] torques ATCC 27756]|uniref:Conserved domain protein n=1 Tax=[Ruminococcus] torques ATCC 27756 TaxID=411460 RepID=A5KNB6_9FIRM|nr:conserved domain protein [[Ruminococcus] torques ATCC 27756]
MADSEVIQNYHAHGECEQFHSEIKTDMDVERLPSGKFDTNELVLELTILAYSIGHLSHPITLSTYLQAY